MNFDNCAAKKMQQGSYSLIGKTLRMLIPYAEMSVRIGLWPTQIFSSYSLTSVFF